MDEITILIRNDFDPVEKFVVSTFDTRGRGGTSGWDVGRNALKPKIAKIYNFLERLCTTIIHHCKKEVEEGF